MGELQHKLRGAAVRGALLFRAVVDRAEQPQRPVACARALNAAVRKQSAN